MTSMRTIPRQVPPASIDLHLQIQKTFHRPSRLRKSPQFSLPYNHREIAAHRVQATRTLTKPCWSSNAPFDGANRSNPTKSPRKQITTIDKAPPSSPTRFRLPPSPHKASSPQFWDKENHFSWIDSHSPSKPTSTITKPNPSLQSQLSSISKTKKTFVQNREQIALDLLREIDEHVMGGKLAAGTASTGGVKLVWSTRLRTAAGRAHWSKVKSRPMGDPIATQHNLKIELSTKIISDEGP